VREKALGDYLVNLFKIDDIMDSFMFRMFLELQVSVIDKESIVVRGTRLFNGSQNGE